MRGPSGFLSPSVVTWAYPTFIAPLFNKFTPLADDSLKQRTEALLARCGFASNGVFVMDGSRRSVHGNAYFTGVGRNKRIVFFDTLIERLQAQEIEAVLAHELGHFRLHHVRSRLMLSVLMGLGGLALLGCLAAWPAFYAALGIAQPSPHTALLLFMIGLPVFTFFLTPLGAWWSRKHEFEADEFAAKFANARELARGARQTVSRQRHDVDARTPCIPRSTIRIRLRSSASRDCSTLARDMTERRAGDRAARVIESFGRRVFVETLTGSVRRPSCSASG